MATVTCEVVRSSALKFRVLARLVTPLELRLFDPMPLVATTLPVKPVPLSAIVFTDVGWSMIVMSP